MRSLFVAACLCAALAAGAQSPPVVDLDQPGALARLRLDQPRHYARIADEMNKLQAVPFTEKSPQGLRVNPRTPDPAHRQIETSAPAKTRMTIPIDDVVYRITVTISKSPAQARPAR